MKTQQGQVPARLRAYSIRFHGRRAGAIGICHEIEASRFAHSAEEAIRLLYEPIPVAFEHITAAVARAVDSPFDASGLVLVAQNDRDTHERICSLVALLQNHVARLAAKQREANRQWHDDAEAWDHGLYHAGTAEQYPAEVQIEAVAELVLARLRETPEALAGASDLFDRLALRGTKEVAS
jgi:hypothetical protein